MATYVMTHEVDDVDHWLSWPKREELFGANWRHCSDLLGTQMDPARPRPSLRSRTWRRSRSS